MWANQLPGASPLIFIREPIKIRADTFCRSRVLPAWPLGQDVCRIIKQRFLELVPSMQTFLDVDDLTT